MDCFVAFAPRNDVRTHLRVLAARYARVMPLNITLRDQEGAGNAGRWPHPWPACKTKSRRQSPQVQPITRHSPRNGFTAYSALSPGTGLFCPRHFADTSAKLDASVGASGPHDFAVRERSTLVRSATCVHRIPPRVRDDRETPLYRDRMGGKMPVIWGADQSRGAATDWHDGQVTRGSANRNMNRKPSAAGA